VTARRVIDAARSRIPVDGGRLDSRERRVDGLATTRRVQTVEDGGFGLEIISTRRFRAGGGRNAVVAAAAVARGPCVLGRRARCPIARPEGLRCVLGNFFVVSGERSPGLVDPGTHECSRRRIGAWRRRGVGETTRERRERRLTDRRFFRF